MNYLVAYLPDGYLHEMATYYAKQRAADLSLVEPLFDLTSPFGIPGALNKFFGAFSTPPHVAATRLSPAGGATRRQPRTLRDRPAIGWPCKIRDNVASRDSWT